MNRIGIDLGGTKIEGIVLTSEHQEVARKRIATEQEKGYEAILEKICDLYRELADSIKNEPHTLGIGTPGATARRTGLLKNSNTICLNGRPLRADLERLLGRRFSMQNDANCFALAEAMEGAGKGKAMVFGVIMGTGCGGGIVFNGRIHEGLQSIAGEWGHTAIDPRGPACYCGSRGCVETFISGGGVEKFYAYQFQEKKPLPDIIADYRQKEKRAIQIMRIFFANFGRAMANLINVLDPDIVVLGGGVSNIDELYVEGVSHVRRMVFSDDLETPIVKHQLGDSAGVIGAALVGI